MNFVRNVSHGFNVVKLYLNFVRKTKTFCPKRWRVTRQGIEQSKIVTKICVSTKICASSQ